MTGCLFVFDIKINRLQVLLAGVVQGNQAGTACHAGGFSEDSKYLFIHADNSIFVYNLKDSDVVYFAKIDVGPCSGPFKFDEMTQQIIAYYGTSIRVFDVSLYFDKSKPIDEKIDLWLQSVTQHLGLKFLGAKYMYDKRQENSHADHVDKYYQDF